MLNKVTMCPVLWFPELNSELGKSHRHGDVTANPPQGCFSKRSQALSWREQAGLADYANVFRANSFPTSCGFFVPMP